MCAHTHKGQMKRRTGWKDYTITKTWNTLRLHFRLQPMSLLPSTRCSVRDIKTKVTNKSYINNPTIWLGRTDRGRFKECHLYRVIDTSTVLSSVMRIHSRTLTLCLPVQFSPSFQVVREKVWRDQTFRLSFGGPQFRRLL